MYILYAEKSRLVVRAKPDAPLTSGSVNVWPVKFEFSPDWEGLERTAVFRAVKGDPKSRLLGDDNACEIPWEVLTASGVHVYAGVYGKRGETTVLPTVWADLGVVAQGAEPGSGAKPPTPDLWEQELARKGDALDYDGLNLSLKSGGKTLSQVQIAGGGGGEGGVSDHRLLTGRDAAEQHPIESITGLNEIPNLRVLEIWNGGMSK